MATWFELRIKFAPHWLGLLVLSCGGPQEAHAPRSPSSTPPPSEAPSTNDERQAIDETSSEGASSTDAAVICERHPGPPLSACEKLYLDAVDPQQHLFAPDEAQLKPRLIALKAALAEASNEQEKQRIRLQLSDALYFRVRGLTRSCHEHEPSDRKKAQEFSLLAHQGREQLAIVSRDFLQTAHTKEHPVLFRLGLVELSLGSFADAARSFGRLLEHDEAGDLAPIAQVGRALALHNAGMGGQDLIRTIGPPERVPSIVNDSGYTAFAAASCLAGQWAQESERPADAKRAYQGFLGWVEDNPTAASKQNSSIAREIRRRLTALETAE